MGSEITHLANQHGDSSREKWKVENSCQLHQPHKACSKDSYLLPRINQLIDSISGHEVFYFLDVYNGYNQIPMHPDDVEK